MFKIRYTYHDPKRRTKIEKLSTDHRGDLFTAAKTEFENIEGQLLLQCAAGEAHGVASISMIGDVWNKKNKVFELRTFDENGYLR